MTKTLIFLSLFLVFLSAYENITISLVPGQTHLFSDFNSSIIHPQFVNHSCVLSTSSGQSSLQVSIFKGTGYVSGYPIENDIEITINEAPLHYFFDVTNALNPEFASGLLMRNIGDIDIKVSCLLFHGLDYFIPQGAEITLQDTEEVHFPLQCRLFTLGKNVPLNVETTGSGYIRLANQQASGTIYVNHLDFGYVVDGSQTTFKLKNEGNADADLLCQNFFG